MKEINLSSGKIATIKEGKGKDLFWAYQMANTPAEIMKLLILRLVEIDGEHITEENLDEMHLQDVMMLMKEVSEITTPLQVKK
jgi:hypothetical protein